MDRIEYQFEKLHVWKGGLALVKEIYKVTRAFPKQEQFGLISQLQRAAVSVPANIAEGRGRAHKAEYLQYLYIARGSLYELLTLIRVAQDQEYLKQEESLRLDGRVRDLIGMLSGLINTLK